MQFLKGPAISVVLEFNDRRLCRTHLQDADSFECQFLGDLDDSAKEILTEFIGLYCEKKFNAILALSLKPILSETMFRLTPFQQKILHFVQKVPAGTTLSYGAIAALVGRPKAARAVGSTCHINPFPFFIPCHRIIASNGSLRGFAFDMLIKKKLLAFESKYTETN